MQEHYFAVDVLFQHCVPGGFHFHFQVVIVYSVYNCDFSKFNTSVWLLRVAMTVFICSINLFKTLFVCLTSGTKFLHSGHGQTPISSGGSDTHKVIPLGAKTASDHLQIDSILTVWTLRCTVVIIGCVARHLGRCPSAYSARCMEGPFSGLVISSRVLHTHGSFVSFVHILRNCMFTVIKLLSPLILRARNLFSSHMSHMSRPFSRRLTQSFEILHWSQRQFSFDILIVVVRESMANTLWLDY